MKGSKKIQDFIKEKEGLKLKPYLCSAKVPTIGYGTTVYPSGVRVTMKDPAISLEDANRYFLNDLAVFERQLVILLGNKLERFTQNQFDALLSFGYNLGMDIDVDSTPEGLGDSTLLKKALKDPNDISIRQEFLKWNKANGKVIKGLTIRRTQEADIYEKGIY
jgi:lysozyme